MSTQLPSNNSQDFNFFWSLGFDTIKELATEQGLLASSRQEIYACIFGRDSLITSLKLLRAYDGTADPYFLGVVRKSLASLAALQGKEINIESGEQPGKCIHEFRTANYEHLTSRPENSWYLYPDKTLRNYDTVDATALFLVAAYRYFQKSRDNEFYKLLEPSITAALEWIFTYGDSNNDGFVDYGWHPQRKSGGLKTQNWMDSEESVFHEDGTEVVFPVAPVEVQAYTYLALKLWSAHFRATDQARAEKLRLKAEHLKTLFNQSFIFKEQGKFSLASGIDGLGRPLAAVRSNMGHCLWASLNEKEDGVRDSILFDEHIPPVAERLLQADLFEREAGIRTLSTGSSRYEPNSYHNGSIWPHDNSIVAEGLEIWGFNREAKLVRRAVLQALEFYKTPIELFVFEEGEYKDYCSPTGQMACKKQAWSAASLLTASLSLRQSQDNTAVKKSM